MPENVSQRSGFAPEQRVTVLWALVTGADEKALAGHVAAPAKGLHCGSTCGPRRLATGGCDHRLIRCTLLTEEGKDLRWAAEFW